MRIAVVGTSNSMMKHGYADAIARSMRVADCRNMSVGKSVSLLFALTTEGLDFSQYDFCIFDFTVNEEIFVRHGITRAAMRDCVLSLAGRAWTSGCLPVLLMLPRRSVLARHSHIRDHYLAIAAELNLPFFDVICHVERLEAERGLARDDMFQDDGHLAEWLAIALGHQLLDALSGLARQSREAIPTPWFCFDYRPLTAASLAGADTATVRRENSVFRLDFAELRPGQAKRASLPAGSEIVGLYANLAATAGFLRLGGATTEIVDLRNAYQGGGRDRFVLSAIALQRPVAAVAGGMSIEVIREQDIDQSARETVLAGIPEREKPKDLAYVELGGLICRSAGRETIATRPAPGLHIDIAAATSPAAVETAIDIFRSHAVTRTR